MLRGDDDNFDNTLYFVPARQEDVAVVYFGARRADDSTGLRYYLQRALGDSPQRKLRLVAVGEDEPLSVDLLERLRLAIVTKPLSDQHRVPIQRYLAAGGTVLVVLVDTDARLLSQLLNIADIKIADIKLAEADQQDFRLLAEVNFQHPLFASLADPRFSDFTKIHFWKHRRLHSRQRATCECWRSSTMATRPCWNATWAPGSVMVLASSWRPVDSQLALSTKFVPLLMALLDRPAEASAAQTQFVVGDQIPQASKNAGPRPRPAYTSSRAAASR